MYSTLILFVTLTFSTLSLANSPYAIPFSARPLNIKAPVCLTGRNLEKNLTGQLVHIIGGSDGNGKGTAAVLASKGAQVTITTTQASNAASGPYPFTVFELGDENNNMTRYWHIYVARFGRMPDVLIDSGLKFITGFMGDLTNAKRQEAMRMYVTDPLEMYYSAMRISKSRGQNLTIAIAESVVGYDALPPFYQLYYVGKLLKKTFIMDFPILEGPMNYPNVRVVGVACAYVDTNIAVDQYNPSVLKGNAFFEAFVAVNIFLNKNVGVDPVVYGNSMLEQIYFTEYPRDSSICIVPHKGPVQNILALYDLLHGIYQNSNTTEYVAFTQYYFKLINLSMESFIPSNSIMYPATSKRNIPTVLNPFITGYSEM